VRVFVVVFVVAHSPAALAAGVIPEGGCTPVADAGVTPPVLALLGVVEDSSDISSEASNLATYEAQ